MSSMNDLHRFWISGELDLILIDVNDADDVWMAATSLVQVHLPPCSRTVMQTLQGKILPRTLVLTRPGITNTTLSVK